MQLIELCAMASGATIRYFYPNLVNRIRRTTLQATGKLNNHSDEAIWLSSCRKDYVELLKIRITDALAQHKTPSGDISTIYYARSVGITKFQLITIVWILFITFHINFLKII